MGGDTLSEVLRAVRLTGAVFFSVDAAAPWVIETPPSREFRERVMPGADHVMEYHVIAAGAGWGGILGEAPVRLEAGSVIAFPQGDAHVISSAPGLRGGPEDAAALRTLPSRLPATIRRDGGGAARAEVICGFLGLDARPFNPLLAALPRSIHVPRSGGGDEVLEQLVKLAVAETAARRAGGEVVLSRVSELLFVELVRRHLAALPPERTGWLAGLRDDAVGRALALLHERPAHGFSLDALAREAGTSRSVLAERFTRLVGLPPMQYLARWRMQLAATLFSTTSLGLAEIAARVGYGSEAALSRAYKRWVGVAPADWRRARRGAPAAGGGASEAADHAAQTA